MTSLKKICLIFALLFGKFGWSQNSSSVYALTVKTFKKDSVAINLAFNDSTEKTFSKTGENVSLLYNVTACSHTFNGEIKIKNRLYYVEVPSAAFNSSNNISITINKAEHGFRKRKIFSYVILSGYMSIVKYGISEKE